MYSCLLKRVLPFTLTLILGSFLGVLFNLHGTGGRFVRMTARLEQDVPFGLAPGRGYGHSCRMYRRNLVAETKPLVILFKPDARWPRGAHYLEAVHALVTFGADGKVQQVEPVNEDLLFEYGQQRAITHIDARDLVWVAAERVARQIQFEPEMINGVPISVTKEVEIHFIGQE